MKCPRDGTKLTRVTIAGVEIDKCHKCDGIWFDRGEMERLRDARLSDVEEQLEQQYGNPSYEEAGTEAHMLCPRCVDARLRQYSYTYMNPVRIDRCERCSGVWLDDEELDSIMREKKEQAVLAYQDQLNLLLQALQSDSGESMARALRREYPVAMIDEFKDTDNIQYRIFEHIYPAGEDGSRGRH